MKHPSSNIAIVTGASSGLGVCYVDAVTRLFPEIEELWLIARREERLKEVAASHPDKRCVVIPMDMADMAGYASLDERLRRERARIQVLINDAGMMGGAPFEEMELEHMMRIIDLNCKGATAITKVCLPYMVDGGTILEVSSTSAFVPNTNQIVYCASKSYLSALCLGLREELKHRKINVCAVCPGLMLTEMVKGDGTAQLTDGQKRLPQIDPATAAIKSLRAARRGDAVYTTGIFYKCYRVLAKLVPHTWLVKVAGLD